MALFTSGKGGEVEINYVQTATAQHRGCGSPIKPAPSIKDENNNGHHGLSKRGTLMQKELMPPTINNSQRVPQTYKGYNDINIINLHYNVKDLHISMKRIGK